MTWTYKVIGTHPTYIIPKVEKPTIDQKLARETESALDSAKKRIETKNHKKDNISMVK